MMSVGSRMMSRGRRSDGVMLQWLVVLVVIVVVIVDVGLVR